MPFSRPARAQQTLHVLIVGDEGVGKTALAERLTSGQFSETQFSSIFNSWSHPMVVDARPVVLSVWEPGSSMRPDLRTRSYIGKDVVMFCYNTNNANTLRSIHEKWMPEVFARIPDVPHLLVACHDDSRVAHKSTHSLTASVSPHAGHAHSHASCSAKTGEGVQKVFELAARLGSQRFGRVSATKQFVAAAEGAQRV